MKKILGIKAISGDIFYGTVNKNGLVVGKPVEIDRKMFENCMYHHIYNNKERYNKSEIELEIFGEKYKLSIKMEEVE